MINFIKSTILLLVLTFPALSVADGNFEATCEYTQFTADLLTMSAQCLTWQGTLRTTQIYLPNGIKNSYGSLRWVHHNKNTRTGNFHLTCWNIRLQYTAYPDPPPQTIYGWNFIILATCDDGQGGQLNTSLTLNNGIANMNGRLTWD